MSHIDMQRAINRTIIRAGYMPSYSAGFNPHALLKLSSPLPLGVQSEAEYLSLEIKIGGKEEFIDKMNSSAPPGLVFLKAWETEKNPNFAGRIVAADYIINTPAACPIRDKIFLSSKESFIVEHRNEKGEVTKKEAKNLIYGLVISETGVFARLASGNTTLRPDRFIETLNREHNLDIKLSDIRKTSAFILENDNFKNIDEIK